MLDMKLNFGKIRQGVAVCLGIGALALMAVAQDFPMHSGNPNRTGLPVDVNAGAFAPNVYNDPGRAFLRWWDPVRRIESVLDNDETSAIGNSGGTPGASWIDATTDTTVAFNYVQKTLGQPIYRHTALVKGTSADNAVLGNSASYSWTYTGLSNASGYELYINLPVGPTDLGGGNVIFPQKYWVVQVSGAQGGNHVDVINYDLHAGGYVRLGNDGNTTSTLFSPTATDLTITLYNVAPIGENGLFLDPNLNANPGLLALETVYADATELVNVAKTGTSSYTASPIVGRLNLAPPGGGTENYPWRTVAARNEQAVVGDLNATFNFATVTSYDYRGTTVPSAFANRYNKVWSWPVRRPFDNSDAEANRFGIDKRDWIMATGKNRTAQYIQIDNLSGRASATGGFALQPGGANNVGPNFLQTTAISGVATQEARFSAQVPDGNYFVDVWLPGVGTNAKGVQVQILLGGTVVDSLSLNMNGAQGWARIPFQSATGYASTVALPITVVITNHVNDSAEAGKFIDADAVRLVRQSDLGIDSTPLQTTTDITVSGSPVQRDVVVVAMENGRLYCMDAHGDPATGAPPQVYWTYPTEDNVDPNDSATEDGKNRIAEMPSGFDLSSSLVANVGGVDLLYVASQNGKVYCLEMSGRGDGTTRRRWTYPDDYDPSPGNQDLPMQPGFLPIKGSIAAGTAGATPVILVPTAEGRIYALDAAGNGATRKTTVVWQYPLAINTPLGPINSTPVVANGAVYFTASPDQASTAGHVYAVDQATGNLLWDQDGAALGGFSLFGASSPVAVPGAQLTNPGGTWTGAADTGADRVFVADGFGAVASLNPATGAPVWWTTELTSGSAGPLRFSFSTQYDNVGNLIQNIPTLFVPTLSGQLVGLNAVGLQNKAGNNKIWGYQTEGTAQMATFANGGFDLALNPHSWVYVGDSDGFFYAFNSIDDNNVLPIIPGIPPGLEAPGDNEPGLDELNSAIDPNKFKLLSPSAFDQIRELADTTGITQAQIQAIVATDFIDRRHFEFGETLYVLIYDLPTLTGRNSNYYVELEASSPTSASQRRQIPTRSYSSGTGNFMISGIPMMTTGIRGVSPGTNYLTAKAVAPSNRGVQGQIVHLPKPATFVPPTDCDFILANPLGVAFLNDTGAVNSSICLNALGATNPKIIEDPSNPLWRLYNQNGSPATDQAPAVSVEPRGNVGPDLRSKGEPVSHGSSGVQQVYVADRSLMNLLIGRGLSGIRVGTRDIAWVKDAGDPTTGGVYKPLLANGVNYPGFEDYPIFIPNRSLDYPDVGRENLSMTANIFGQAQNPLYSSGIEANPPVIVPANFQTYRTKAGYEAQLTRNLSMTIFDTSLVVPRFQPPSNLGYFGIQSVFVDSQSGAANSINSDPFRAFGLGLNVGVDEHLAFKTPTIDLGSLPGGGGYNGRIIGSSFGPMNPWVLLTRFSPWLAAYDNLFQPFVVENEGNVNMLNVRLAKYFFDANGNRPVELYMPGQHELAWLDASLHLHSSIDRRFSSSLRVGSGTPGFDTLGRNILQKARPRDLIGTRLNVNPKSRPNANLQTNGGYLYNPLVIVPGDPKVGATAPLGAPAGEYLRKVFVFEDSNTANNFDADNPSLGEDEPYSDPAANLKFVVREARVTNSFTTKSAPLVDNLLTGAENFTWSNTTPTGMRDGLGNLYVAWASNRVDNGNQPAWTPKSKVDLDLLVQDKWRIYVASLRSILPGIPGESPVNDLNGWGANTANRWFRQTLVIDPPVTLFDVNTGAGETLDMNSVKFGAPAFSTSGFFDQMDAPGNLGRPWYTGRYLAFLGEATKYDASGNATHLSQIFLAPMTFNPDGSININVGNITASPLDSSSTKSKITLTHRRTGNNDFVTVFGTSFSGGLGQILWNTYDGTTWRQNTLRMGNAFENMGSPSAVLRRYKNNGNSARIDLMFTSKVKGRRFSETYMARLNANPNSGFPNGRNPLVPYGTTVAPWLSEITVDPNTGVYWAPGLQWINDQASMDAVDITTDPSGNPATSIWDGNNNTRVFDATSGVLNFNSKFGGQVVIDSANGSIRLLGAVMKRNTRLYLKYRPTIMRISQGDGANYRSVTSAFDDRFIGIRVNAANPQRNLVGDLTNWVNEISTSAVDTDPLRWDRTVVAYSRTSGDGTSATRPFVQTMRPGVQLSHQIRLLPNGTASNFRVDNWGGGPASEHYAQFDPGTGRVFFMAGVEDQTVTITYDAIDEVGNFIGSRQEELVVRLIPEINEQAVPIEQVGNESSLFIALDPLNNAFNNVNPVNGRRPGLMWLFWASSRTGAPDIYFETIAPRFVPKKGTQ